ncbi:MAG: sodium:calcium antiporter, partial [Clostridia bacterium]|nr:sodium:calcium antiporter [Clostridia bacterium]
MATTLCMMEASSMAGCVILLILGIILVVKGGDWFVDAASWIAEVSGIPTFIIGATIVSLATTLPEILVSSISAGQIDPITGLPSGAGMAIGNAVGSVNCNIALIMAISLLFMPVAFKRKDYATKMILLLLAISVLWTVSAINTNVTWWEALIVLAVFIAFMAENVLSAKKHSKELIPAVEADTPIPNTTEEQKPSVLEKLGILTYYVNKQNSKKITLKKSGKVIERKDIFKNIFLFILGAAGIVIGAQLMCDNGAMFAEKLGMSKDLVGVTILAVGTSLPELVTTITAIAKKKSDLSVGNVIGANIID